MAGAGQIRGRRGIIGGYWGGYNLLSSSPTPRALPGKVENLTPPANGKNAPDGAPPAQAVPCWNVASWNRCARIRCSGSGAARPPRVKWAECPGTAPTTRTGTHPAQQIAPPPQTKGQSSSAPRAAALAFFFCPAFTPAACPACRISSPARAGCCRRCYDDHASTPQPQQIAPPAACTGKDQHRQRRTR